MAAPVKKQPIAIDYTSRDYYSLREDLIQRVRANVPTWQGNDPADFGLAMVEAFAYMGDIMSYYLDRVANESYLATANQRQSVINIAKTYGYIPTGYRASSVTLQFSNDSEEDVTIPANSSFVGQVQFKDIVYDLVFTIEEEVVVPAADGEPGTETATAYNYELIEHRPENRATSESDISGELLGVSTGEPEQSYKLLENQIVEGSVRIFVQDGVETSFDEWTYVDHITDYGPNDAVFTTSIDSDNFITVIFGDGVSGTVPPKSAVIKSQYKVGGGIIGNIELNLVTDFYRVPSNDGMYSDAEIASLFSSSVTVTNTSVGQNGNDPESIESIKLNAPKALQALDRAVTTKDYSSLALQVSNVGRANAFADIWSSVNLYVAPQRNASSTDQFPGYSANPDDGGSLLDEWYALKSAVQQYLSSRTQIGVTLNVQPPTYVPVTVDVFYSKEDQYSEAEVEVRIKQAILEGFAYNNTDFADVIHPERVEALLRGVEGVTNVRVTALHRSDADSARKILVGAEDEIFVFLSDDISIAAYSTNTTLSALSLSAGTLSPTFSSSFKNYSVVVPNGTTSTSITLTKGSSQAEVYVNDTLYTSPVSITTNVGITSVVIAVTAGDGVSYDEYTLSISRAS